MDMELLRKGGGGEIKVVVLLKRRLLCNKTIVAGSAELWRLDQNDQPSLEESEAIFPVPSPPQQQRLEVTRGEVFQSQLPTGRSTVNAFKVVIAPKWLTHPCSVTTSSDIM
ncbi:hypothetical protein PMG11_10830 [Penicillium brasilianum]|uniref:Uncharacterized protein n=1 Tax=Penicillium brasilianum TaxID=104259 RepID=A0A0F7U0B9_PENBI|nr:hypothetical protein PMG11_10830 [Penicillium brasilianum]